MRLSSSSLQIGNNISNAVQQKKKTEGTSANQPAEPSAAEKAETDKRQAWRRNEAADTAAVPA